MTDQENETLVVGAEQDGARLDKFLVALLPGASRSVVRRLLEEGAVRVDGRRRSKGAVVHEGEQVAVVGYVGPTSWTPRPDPDLEVNVLYKDRELIVVDKPAGLPCHPLRPEEVGTVASAVVARFPEVTRVGGDRREGGLVHRLDTETSGVLVFARRNAAYRGLVSQLRRDGGAIKLYDALVEGDAEGLSLIDRPLRSRGRRMSIAEEGQEGRDLYPARTLVRPRRRLAGFTLLEVEIGAGRRHQIRAHLAGVGHPIAGDGLYGASLELPLSRPFLHAREIVLRHPASGEELRISAPLPEELRAALAALEGQG